MQTAVIECKKELSGRDGFGAASSLFDFTANSDVVHSDGKVVLKCIVREMTR